MWFMWWRDPSSVDPNNFAWKTRMFNVSAKDHNECSCCYFVRQTVICWMKVWVLTWRTNLWKMKWLRLPTLINRIYSEYTTLFRSFQLISYITCFWTWTSSPSKIFVLCCQMTEHNKLSTHCSWRTHWSITNPS